MLCLAFSARRTSRKWHQTSSTTTSRLTLILSSLSATPAINLPELVEEPDDEALVTTIQNGVARDARYAVVISIQRQLTVPPSLEQLKTAVNRQWSTIEDEKTAKKLEAHSLDHA
eukprot:517731-Rhodomonas_salina.1